MFCFNAVFVVGCASTEAQLVKYSYTGPTMTVITGVLPPWTTESHMSGYFVVEELPPSTTTDFLDPDIDWPFVNLPKQFAFTDGARTITQSDIEENVKDTGLRIDPRVHEVRAFSVTTDAAGKFKLIIVADVQSSSLQLSSVVDSISPVPALVAWPP